MKKENIVKYAGAGLISVGTLAICFGAIIHDYDQHIDHLHEYCPLNNLFGVEHQINQITSDYCVYGIGAYYEPESVIEENIMPSVVECADGSTYYRLPDDYVLENGVGVKKIKKPERIVVTQGEPIFPEGLNPGDLVKKSDIEIINSEDVYDIPVLKKSK